VSIALGADANEPQRHRGHREFGQGTSGSPQRRKEIGQDAEQTRGTRRAPMVRVNPRPKTRNHLVPRPRPSTSRIQKAGRPGTLPNPARNVLRGLFGGRRARYGPGRQGRHLQKHLPLAERPQCIGPQVGPLVLTAHLTLSISPSPSRQLRSSFTLRRMGGAAPLGILSPSQVAGGGTGVLSSHPNTTYTRRRGFGRGA